MFIITFRIPDANDVKVSAESGQNLLEVAQSAGVVIDAPCAGNGTCGKCRVVVSSGVVDSVSNIHLSEEDFAEGWRLACQSTVCGDAMILVPSELGDFRKGIQTADLSSTEEMERYQQQIQTIFQTGIVQGRKQTGFGLAVDIGTTTVAAVLMNLETGQIIAKASMGNGQIRFGADVINRIINQRKPGGVDRLRKAVREETLIPLIDELCEQAHISSDAIKIAVISGNTTMEHLFVGANGDTIRLEPYEPEFLELHDQTAALLGLPLDPAAPVILSPNVGSYFGGDLTAGVLASLLWNSDEQTLFIDLGTNGEIVFGNKDFMLCCACSAGPAFEGGDISSGMRATKGAISACTIDADTMEPTYEIIASDKPAGLCGSGLIDLVAALFEAGIISPKGKFIREGERIRRYEGGAEYIVAHADQTSTGRDITITETDLDNFIRAKGAIFSAICALMESVDMPLDAIERVIIAGGIGSGIDISHAIAIGMLPKLPLESYTYIGNSSLTGSCAMLLSEEAEKKVFDLAHNMTYIELSTHPGYMEEFVAACFLPHTNAHLFSD